MPFDLTLDPKQVAKLLGYDLNSLPKDDLKRIVTEHLTLTLKDVDVLPSPTADGFILKVTFDF